MKVRIEHLILLFGVLISTTISIVEKPIVTVYESHGNYYDISDGRIVEIRNPDQLRESGKMYVDFPGASYQMYSAYTLAGRISYWTLAGSILLSCSLYVFNEHSFFKRRLKK